MTDATADADDMAALQAGEGTALDRLMSRWQVPLRAFLFRHLQNEQDALDLAQETFVRIYRHRDRFVRDRRFSTWMFQIALNLARDQGRRTARRPTITMEDAPEPFDLADLEANAMEAETAAAVRQAIAALPSPLREAVILFEYEDKSHAEIAEIVGATPKAVETRLHRARALLRPRLLRWLQR